jgi:hypothetical protein
MPAIELIEKLGSASGVADLTKIDIPSDFKWKENNRLPNDKLIRLAPVAEAQEVSSRKTFSPSDWQDIWSGLIDEPVTTSTALNFQIAQVATLVRLTAEISLSTRMAAPSVTFSMRQESMSAASRFMAQPLLPAGGHRCKFDY